MDDIANFIDKIRGKIKKTKQNILNHDKHNLTVDDFLPDPNLPPDRKNIIRFTTPKMLLSDLKEKINIKKKSLYNQVTDKSHEELSIYDRLKTKIKDTLQLDKQNNPKNINKLTDLENWLFRLKNYMTSYYENQNNSTNNIITNCANCGAKLDKDQIFCSTCGKKKGLKLDPLIGKKNTCLYCGKIIDPFRTYCLLCGMDLEESLIDFKGVKIAEYEIKALKELEKVIVHPIDYLENKDSSGFIVKNKHINKLKIINSVLEDIPESIYNLNNLEVLIINGCKLTRISESIELLDSLRILDLDHNSISTLPNSILELNSLERISIRFNPLSEDSKRKLFHLSEKNVKIDQ
ncbi:MAG: zinc ribbon domain-containing protein [Candidatus Lokiarchaeota archaeon]|nr:zinc ribbon domain-containing protein [Candidatus Lokiarchaeota archaeon]